MQRLDFGPHLFERQLAVGVTLINGLGYFARLKSFQADRGESLLHLTPAFDSILLGDFEGRRHDALRFQVSICGRKPGPRY